MLTAIKAALIRTTSSGTMGLTVYGFLIAFVALSVAFYVAKSKIEDYWQARDESRKVEAVIESNTRAVKDLNQFNKEVKDGEEKIGTSDIYDLIN